MTVWHCRNCGTGDASIEAPRCPDCGSSDIGSPLDEVEAVFTTSDQDDTVVLYIDTEEPIRVYLNGDLLKVSVDA